jgi:hypothetical protein
LAIKTSKNTKISPFCKKKSYLAEFSQKILSTGAFFWEFNLCGLSGNHPYEDVGKMAIIHGKF